MPNLLIVDDAIENLILLGELLDNEHDIRVAKSGEEALSLLQDDAAVDLILLDVVMPGLDGFEVCSRLKGDARTRDIPVIFLTAMDDEKDEALGLELGAIDYIKKPFSLPIIRARIHTHLELQSINQRLRAEGQRLRTLADSTFEGIVIHDGQIIGDVNRVACRLLDAQRSSLVGEPLMALFAPDHAEAVLREDQPTTLAMRRPDGKELPVEVCTRLLQEGDTPQLVTAIRDLSAAQKAEEESRLLQQENSALRGSISDRYRFGELIGRSPAMQAVYELISRAAASDYNVLVTGASGTGKELVARTIHQLSARLGQAYVVVNCGAITETLFEREFFGHKKGAFTGADRSAPGYMATAHEGTLFLDELGELPAAMQVKLLRVLESGEYVPVGESSPRRSDVRLVAATNRDLAQDVSLGRFREDLFYRVQVIEINLPPLSARREDIPLLAEHFLASNTADGAPARLPGKVMDTLVHHDWPGNVRELQNAVQRYLALGHLAPTMAHGVPEESTVGEDFEGTSSRTPGSQGLVQGRDLTATLDAYESQVILAALQHTQWHRGQAAERLDITRRTLQRKMNQHELRKNRDS